MMTKNSYGSHMTHRHIPTPSPQHTAARTVAEPSATTPFPSIDEVNSLGEMLARDGFGLHEQAVSRLIGLVRRVTDDHVSVDVLDDRSAPPVVRDRAFAAVSARWPEYHQALLGQREGFDASFDALRSAWLSHDRVRHSEPSFEELWRSRTVLDQTRIEVARRRRAAFGGAEPALASR